MGLTSSLKEGDASIPIPFERCPTLTALPILERDVPNISGYCRLVHIEPRAPDRPRIQTADALRVN